MARRAYLTKVAVQTFWVVVDDESGEAIEHTDTGVVVPATDWSGFYERHCEDFKAIQSATMAEGNGKKDSSPEITH